VAFFLRGGAQLASGRGELLEPLPDPPRVRLVLLTPPLALARKTARLYAALRPEHVTDGSATARLASKLHDGGTPGPADYMNAFDGVADAMYPGLIRYRLRLEKVAGSRALLAGAGPSLFAVSTGDPTGALAREIATGDGRWQVVETAGTRSANQA
jgi:4-diphosphocytidyl-2-C-methyl-D-erythritol kinase